MLKTKRHIIFFGLVWLSLLYADKPAWPMDVHPSLSSNFGEFRGDHFHMGLDFRTGGTIGHPVFAIDDGYVSRMVTNYSGYGKALYCTTSDGLTAVYAHLSEFTPVLEKILRLHQTKGESYFVNQYFTPEMIPVKKGELIGYSGNTGSSFGPHLHFELRNKNEQPLNPSRYGFAIPDRISPEFKELAIIPVESGARIQGSSLPQTFPLFRDRAGVYHFPDTLHCSGRIGFAAQVVDKTQGTNNTYQVYTLTLIIDDNEMFTLKYDHLDFAETRTALTVQDYRLERLSLGEFQRLFRPSHHPKTTIHTTEKTGDVMLTPGYHTVKIIAEDAAGNASAAAGTVFSYPPLNIKVDPAEETDETKTFFVAPARGSIPIQSVVCYSFTPFGYADKKLKPIQIENFQKGIKVTYSKKDIERKNLQFIGTNKMGAGSKPFHWFSNDTKGDILDVNKNLKFSHTDAGIFLQLDLEKPVNAHAEVRLQKNNSPMNIPLEHIHPAVYLSELLPPAVFKDVDHIEIVLKNDVERIIRHHITPKLCIPSKKVSVLSLDKNCSIQAPKETLYHPTLVWIDRVENGSNIKQGTQCSNVYQLQPYEIPLKAPVKVGIRYGDEFALEKGLGIYGYDRKKEKWTYLPSKNNSQKRVLTTEIKEFNAVVVLQDIAPPAIKSTFPKQGVRYDYKDVEILRVFVNDDLSGIAANEESISLKVDNERVLAAYQPIKKEISYRLSDPLKNGNHTLEISVQDKAGNITKKTVNFSIK